MYDLFEALNRAHKLDEQADRGAGFKHEGTTQKSKSLTETSKKLSVADKRALEAAAKKLGYQLDKIDYREARKFGVQEVIDDLQTTYKKLQDKINSKSCLLTGKIVSWKYLRTRLDHGTDTGYDVTIRGDDNKLYHSFYSLYFNFFLGRRDEPFMPFTKKVNAYDEIIGDDTPSDSTPEEWHMSGLVDDITAVIRGCTINGTDLSDTDYSVELAPDESYIQLSYVDANDNTYSTRITDVYSAPEGGQALMNWIESLSWTKDND